MFDFLCILYTCQVVYFGTLVVLYLVTTVGKFKGYTGKRLNSLKIVTEEIREVNFKEK